MFFVVVLFATIFVQVNFGQQLKYQLQQRINFLISQKWPEDFGTVYLLFKDNMKEAS